MMTIQQLAALEAGSPVGVQPQSAGEPYGIHFVDRLTKTQIVIVVGTHLDGSKRELRFNRGTGHQVGAGPWTFCSLVPVEEAVQLNVVINARQAHRKTVNEVKALDWRFVKIEVLQQVLALHAAASAKEGAANE